MGFDTEAPTAALAPTSPAHLVPGPMRPPGIPVLLLLNAAVGFDLYLTISVANQVWSAAGWGPGDVGAIMAIACLAYAGPVSLGGQLADRWGRARAGVV